VDGRPPHVRESKGARALLEREELITRGGAALLDTAFGA
jgi:hypothetical protein